MVTILRPVAASSSCIATGLGNLFLSHVKYLCGVNYGVTYLYGVN